jgi:glyoxylase-like metal-dependent hydrolase (beta-lactamase superfamily II)
MEGRCLTVGPVQENCWIVWQEDSQRALVIDPGEEAPRILATLEEHGLTAEAILLTHTHFDHVGAVAEVARATGAPVTCPELEVEVLADINRFMRFPGFGPFESYDADETVAGGERLDLAGFGIDVLFVPGHSPGHVAYSFADEGVLISGDVLFEGSIGRTDLPGGDHQTLLASIAMLLDRLPADTEVLPGHMGTTTLARERASNPFLQELPA